jgi:urea transport system permease protein
MGQTGSTISGLMHRIVLAIAALLLSVAGSSADISKPVERFAQDSFSETRLAVEEITASGVDHAAELLEALAAGRLFIDPATKTAYYRDASGRNHLALTGAEVSSLPAKLDTVRVNNRIRSDVANAVGSLTLLAAAPARRVSAAEALFKSRDATALPALEAAIKAEKDPKVTLKFTEARAAILLGRDNTSRQDRIEAIEVLRARGDPAAAAVLRGLPASVDSETKGLAASAIASIEHRQKIIGYVQNVWHGLSLGSVLLLAAIGLAITFGVMGVINMAHGEMVMLGAYTTFVVQEAFRDYAPAYMGWSLPIALPLAFLVTGLVGIAIERGVIRFLYGRPLETLLATWGVSLILQQAVRTIFGPTNREVTAPSYMSGAFDLFGLSITWGRMWIVLFTLVLFAALLVALKATPLGLQMRAVTQNRRMASSMGIRTPFVDAMTFGFGSGLAGLAGVALSQIDNVSPNLGQSYIIDSFMVVVFGGVGNLWGTLVSAFALGVANKFLEPMAGAVLAKIFILVLLILFIQKRPRGLFALKGRAVEA